MFQQDRVVMMDFGSICVGNSLEVVAELRRPGLALCNDQALSWAILTLLIQMLVGNQINHIQGFHTLVDHLMNKELQTDFCRFLEDTYVPLKLVNIGRIIENCMNPKKNAGDLLTMIHKNVSPHQGTIIASKSTSIFSPFPMVDIYELSQTEENPTVNRPFYKRDKYYN